MKIVAGAQLNPIKRELMLRVMDDCIDLKDLMFIWSSKQRIEEVLIWLIENYMTGKNLMAYIKSRPGEFNVIYTEILARLDVRETGFRFLQNRS